MTAKKGKLATLKGGKKTTIKDMEREKIIAGNIEEALGGDLKPKKKSERTISKFYRVSEEYDEKIRRIEFEERITGVQLLEKLVDFYIDSKT